MLTTGYNARMRKTSRNLWCAVTLKKKKSKCSFTLGHVILQNIIFSYKFTEPLLTEFCQNLSVQFIGGYMAVSICKIIINTNYLYDDF